MDLKESRNWPGRGMVVARGNILAEGLANSPDGRELARLGKWPVLFRTGGGAPRGRR